MYQDEPMVDSSFQQFEKINGPYLNNMISPVYVKSLDGKFIHDKYGNKYHIEDSVLYKEDKELFTVENKKFVRTEIDFSGYLTYDISSNWSEGVPTARASWDGINNRIKLEYYDTTVYTDRLYDEGHLITSRVRIINDCAVLVVYYDKDNVEYVKYVKLDLDDNKIEIDFTANWQQQTIKYTASASYTTSSKTIKNADPIIYISYNDATDLYCVSLVSKYGMAMNSQDNGFITFVEKDATLYFDSTNATHRFVPNSTSVPSQTTTDYYSYFTVRSTGQSNSANGNCITSDFIHYYFYDEVGVVGEEMDLPSTYVPDATQNTVEIDGTTYTICTYTATRSINTLTFMQTEVIGDSWKASAVWIDGTTYDTADDNTQTKTITVEKIWYRGQTVSRGWNSMSIQWTYDPTHIVDSAIPSSYGNGTPFRMQVSVITIGLSSYLVAPDVFMDSNEMVSFWKFNPSSSSWNSLPVSTPANSIVESAYLTSYTENGDILSFDFTIVEKVDIVDGNKNIRTNSFVCNQNFWQTNVRACNSSAITPTAMMAATGKNETGSSAVYSEYVNTNCSDLRYLPGTVNGTSNNLDTYYNYYISLYDSPENVGTGPIEDFMNWTVAGFRTNITDNWHILYNTTYAGTCVGQSLSYSELPDEMGTLVVPWVSLDDGVNIVANDYCLIYKASDGKYYKISIEEGNEMYVFFKDRYIVVNTTSYWNCYDTVLGKKYHYATDYNARSLAGSTSYVSMTGTSTQSRTFATAINAAYNTTQEYICSEIYPFYSLRRIWVDDDVKAFNCISPESSDTQVIDVYYSALSATSAPRYRYSIAPYSSPSIFSRYNLEGTVYPVSGTIYVNPNIFTKYVDGVGNHDAVIEANSTFIIQYSTVVPSPVFLYSIASETYDTQAFFVLQGQYYGVINDKIYSLIFSQNVISEMDAIIDCRGMVFVGNNPMIAFFWSPSKRMFYSFTGDANLTPIYNASKFSQILLPDHTHYYDEMTQSIYVPTDAGLLVFGPKNTYLFENWKNVDLVQATEDGVTHVTNDNNTYDFVYYPADGYEPLKLNVETAFWGPGSNAKASIDRYDIVLFDISHTKPETTITVGCRSLTDITVKSEEKDFTIKPNDWDKWSDSAFIPYIPKLPKGQGVRLYIKSDIPIAKIVAHTMDLQSSTIAKGHMTI